MLICDLRWFSNVKRIFIRGINHTWSLCIIIFIHCWTWFAKILFRIFVRMLMRDTGLWFSFLVMSWSVLNWDVFSYLQFSRRVYTELILFLPNMFNWIHQWSHLGLKFSLQTVFNNKFNFFKSHKAWVGFCNLCLRWNFFTASKLSNWHKLCIIFPFIVLISVESVVMSLCDCRYR